MPGKEREERDTSDLVVFRGQSIQEERQETEVRRLCKSDDTSLVYFTDTSVVRVEQVVSPKTDRVITHEDVDRVEDINQEVDSLDITELSIIQEH